MTDFHARARELMLDAAIGEISSDDSTWLTRHLAECEDCARERDELADSMNVFRAASVNAPAFLAARTSAGVRSRITEISAKTERRTIIWLAILFDLGWTSLAIAFLMNAATWFGVSIGTNWMWMIALSWFWLLPGMAGLLLVVMKRNGVLPGTPAWHWLGAEGETRG